MKNDITAFGWETLESQRAKSNKVLNDLILTALSNLFMRQSYITDYERRGSSTSQQISFFRSDNF